MKKLCLITLVISFIFSCQKNVDSSSSPNNSDKKKEFIGLWVLTGYKLGKDSAKPWQSPVEIMTNENYLGCKTDGKIENCGYLNTCGVNRPIRTKRDTTSWWRQMKETYEMRADDTLKVTLYREDSYLDYNKSTCSGFKLVYRDSSYTVDWARFQPSTWKVNAKGDSLSFIFEGSYGGGYQHVSNDTDHYKILEKTATRLVLYGGIAAVGYNYPKYLQFTKQ